MLCNIRRVATADHYKAIRNIYSHIENDDSKIQSLKIFIYTMLKQQGKEDDFAKYNDIINENTNDLISRLSFQKITKKMLDSHFDPWLNTSYLSFDGLPITRTTIATITNDLESNIKKHLVFPDTNEGALSKGRIVYNSAKV